jgi:transposase InsO family protein
MINLITKKRLDIKRSSEVVHRELENEGIKVSISSVKRTLDRNGLLKKRSPWKRYHTSISRPEVLKQGDLVQVDTIHLMVSEKKRIYVFTLIDVYSRWCYARSYDKSNTHTSLDFLKKAQADALFTFKHLQSDNGPEFSTYFSENVKIKHRHSRVRKPNDNAHLERFNRTIQEECLDHVKRDVSIINKELPKYLKYYNEERLHFGISLRAPMDLLRK